MALSKKQASVLLATILLVGLAMFFLTPTLFDQDPSNPDPNEPENPVEEDDQGEIESVNFEGISVLPDGNAIVFSDVIADNHRNELLNNSVELEYRTPNSDVTIKKFGNRVLTTDEGDFRTSRRYTDGVLTYESTEVDGETSYSAERGSTSSSEYYKGSLFRSVLKDLQVRTVKETEDGIFLRLTGSSELDNINTVISEYNEVDEADADLKISNSGAITDMKLQIIGPNLFGVPQSSTYYYNITQMSGVEVNTPTWVDNVKDEVSIISSEPDSDNDWITLQHEGLATIPSESNVTILTSQGESANLNITQTVRSGDTIYLSPEDDGWNVYVNQEPTAERELESGSEVIVSISNEVDGEIVEYYGETITVGS